MNEDQTVSVAKGVFLFKNDFKPRIKKTQRRKKKSDPCVGNPYFENNLWYQSYIELWSYLEEKIEDLNNDMFSSILSNLLNFIKTSYQNKVDEIPAAALLTGINMPDHTAQFSTLAKKIKQDISPHVAYLCSQECQNIKYLIEHMINQFINDDDTILFSQDSDMEIDEVKKHIKRNNLNLSLLQSWYHNLYKAEFRSTPNKKQKTKCNDRVLVLIIPDFESFNVKILQRFILIISSYINILPFVLVFGVATSLTTLHTSLPYHVSSKIRIQVFNSQPSTVYLNNVLETVFFTVGCPFQIGGKVFNLFTDIFLFYDLSVTDFIKNIKHAMAEHFCYGNAMALCNSEKMSREYFLQEFTHDDCENARQLMSFRKLVENESYENRIKLINDDHYFKEILKENVENIWRFIRRFHLFIRCLHLLVLDLPGAPLGKKVREIYATAVSTNISKTSQYAECFQLLAFQSKDELSTKLSHIIDYMSTIVNGACKKPNKLQEILIKLKMYLNNMNTFDVEEPAEFSEEMEIPESSISEQVDNRKQLKEKLLGMSKQNVKHLNKYEIIRKNLLEFISKTFETYLHDPSTLYFHEIFFYNDISIQNNIVGIHRTAIHNALNDPHHYLQCSCCEIPSTTSIRSCMPDICIAYKLHLECGKMINLYDWLQAFLSIVDPTEDDEDSKRTVNPKLQARFTQAVAELEYLGFIKSSKRKADHVSRLTWGG